MKPFPLARTLMAPLFLLPLLALPGIARAETACGMADPPQAGGAAPGPKCLVQEQITIFGQATEVRDIAGGANALSNADLREFVPTDVTDALQQLPGIAIQREDGYGLRPNLSIRGTATDRSSRITLLEDNVLIAPAPYAAPAAYYFPTFGRIYAVEVLKGPAAITQGPYTIGGAINLLATPIPEHSSGRLVGELGSDDTWRAHGWYGGGSEQARFLVETHQWGSDGFQTIDRSSSDTGFEKQDYLARLAWDSDPAGSVRHAFDLKLQDSSETSRQSYLGLTDADFAQASLRRYGASSLDEMNTDHGQITAGWTMELESGLRLTTTLYNNEFERAWYKTEALDPDGSASAQAFRGTSWANVIRAVNLGASLGGVGPQQLQAILDGADTPAGSIQLRNNSREYYSRGLQAALHHELNGDAGKHAMSAGLRLHEDEEDRLQRNDSYQQLGGHLVLNDTGLQGNAGNRIESAEAWAAWIQDRIEWSSLTLTPGLRFESIDLQRLDYNTSSSDPASRDPANLKTRRSNQIDVWLPGIGALYDLEHGLRLVAGIHKGFAVPTNQPGVDPEESINYELGLRFEGQSWQLDAMGFFNDYENLVGLCTNSTGSDCEPGDAFNGEGVHIPGLELAATASWSNSSGWNFPQQLTYTWMDAEFQSDFVSEFFGPVQAGDPVPYIPEHQLHASTGLENGPWSVYLAANFVDSACTTASCGAFESTESLLTFKLAAHYRIRQDWELYALAENLLDEIGIVARDPYGARPNQPRNFTLGMAFDF